MSKRKTTCAFVLGFGMGNEMAEKLGGFLEFYRYWKIRKMFADGIYGCE